MIDNVILFLLDRLSFLFNSKEVNYKQLRLIVAVKLKMDNRRQRFKLGGNDSSHQVSNGFTWQLAILLFFSALISLLILFVPSVMLTYTVIAAYTLLMIIMILITDFSQVLLDNSDSAIILPRPVSSKTYYFAKLTHVLSYMFQIGMALALPPALVTFYKFGFLGGVVFLISTCLLVVLAVFFTNLLYLVLIRYASEDALQNVINYVQIGVTIVVMAGYQLVFRVFGNDLLQAAEAIEPSYLHLLLPPFWLGYVMDGLIGTEFTLIIATATGLLLVTPVVTTLIMNTGLLQDFGTRLGHVDAVTKPGKIVTRRSGKSFAASLSNWFLKTPAEKAAFEFVWKMVSRDRKFKLRTYPSLAYLLVYIPVIFTSGVSENSFSELMEELSDSPGTMLSLIYFTVLMINVVQTNVVFYDEPKASWIYGTSPLKNPGELLSGQFWAIFFKFQFPAVLLTSLLVVPIWGISSTDDILLGLSLMMIFQLLINIGFKSKLPFSVKFESGKNANFIQVIGYMIAIGVIAGLHWLLMKVPYAVSIFLPFLALIVWYLSKELRKVLWSKIEY